MGELSVIRLNEYDEDGKNIFRMKGNQVNEWKMAEVNLRGSSKSFVVSKFPEQRNFSTLFFVCDPILLSNHSPNLFNNMIVISLMLSSQFSYCNMLLFCGFYYISLYYSIVSRLFSKLCGVHRFILT